MAVIVQVPAASNVTEFPLTVQMEVDWEVKITGLPDPPEVAAKVNGATPSVLAPGLVKPMFCAVNAVTVTVALAATPVPPAFTPATV